MQEFEISETLDSKFSWVSEWDWKYNKVRAKEKILHSLERKKILHKTLRNLPLKIYWSIVYRCAVKRGRPIPFIFKIKSFVPKFSLVSGRSRHSGWRVQCPALFTCQIAGSDGGNHEQWPGNELLIHRINGNWSGKRDMLDCCTVLPAFTVVLAILIDHLGKNCHQNLEFGGSLIEPAALGFQFSAINQLSYTELISYMQSPVVEL